MESFKPILSSLLFLCLLIFKESFSAHDLKNPRGYHWDTSDWMPSVQLPGIQEYPQYEIVEAPVPLYSDLDAIDTDYYPGGYDIESDFPPPPDDFPVQEELPPLPELQHSDGYGTSRATPPPASSPGSSSRGRPPHDTYYSLGEYLPRHRYPTDLPEGYGSMPLSLYTSAASCSDVSACCEESEVMMSEYESVRENSLSPPASSVKKGPEEKFRLCFGVWRWRTTPWTVEDGSKGQAHDEH
ncbi:hypothetical protein Z043_109566 [Scleropages formosus]|uniref:Uncharacterized protein n=1 Tax=Scleropages formosus TaxID=113540 RepID=A0A0P7UBR9_SCLFO|nr:hypothetical protein Z043_109566 [Scleropages formosus]